MSSDLSTKVQNVLWWITSIATSVVCCSIIFVLFASYFVDLREDIRDSNRRINLVEEREERILNEIQMIRKHGVEQTEMPAASAAAPGPSPAVPPAADEAPAALVGTTGAGPEKAAPSNELPSSPAIAPMTVPDTGTVVKPSTPAATQTAPAALSLPPLTPPSMAPAPEKK